jgi:hypothetical protein
VSFSILPLPDIAPLSGPYFHDWCRCPDDLPSESWSRCKGGDRGDRGDASPSFAIASESERAWAKASTCLGDQHRIKTSSSRDILFVHIVLSPHLFGTGGAGAWHRDEFDKGVVFQLLSHMLRLARACR